MILHGLALSRGTHDRKAQHREDEAWLAGRWADPRTRVLVITPDGPPATGSGRDADGEALVRDDSVPALVFISPAEAPPDGDRYFLGTDTDDIAYFAVSGPLPAIEAPVLPSGLRKVGALLSDRDAGLLTHAIGLRNWHAKHPFCPRCGARTTIASAGSVRVCPADGSQHFPRVDPAVIMLVRDSRDRILLARGPSWPADWMSILAGFVEPGESLEQAVAREVYEEVGLVVDDCRYVGSQPWPMPQSLMLGFSARALDDQELRVDPGEIAEARWFARDELRQAVESGELVMSGRLSIARHIIESWYGSPLPG